MDEDGAIKLERLRDKANKDVSISNRRPESDTDRLAIEVGVSRQLP